MGDRGLRRHRGQHKKRRANRRGLAAPGAARDGDEDEVEVEVEVEVQNVERLLAALDGADARGRPARKPLHQIWGPPRPRSSP